MIKAISIAAAAGLLALSGCAQPVKTSGTTHAVSVADAAQARVTARGSFEGRSKHVTTGHASIGRVDGQWVVILENDFTFDGAPDPHVALGHDGYRKDASLAMLSSNAGRQVYAIPATLDVADFNEVWIWCNKFAVPLGVASLELTT